MRNKWINLFVLMLVYVIGELSHFLLGTTTQPMSQEIQYGDQGCLTNHEMNGTSTVQNIKCYIANDSLSCSELGQTKTSNVSACFWDYSGLGYEYQLLAGPAFVLVFTIAGVIIALISDRFNRVVVVTICLAVLTFSTTMMGASQMYWHLIILRMMIGASESAFSPACSSMISDMFEQSQRGFALGVFNWGIYFGYGMAYAIGNFVTKADIAGQGWRMSYYISGILGTIVTLVMIVLVREPRRNEDGDRNSEDKNSYTLPQLDSSSNPAAKHSAVSEDEQIHQHEENLRGKSTNSIQSSTSTLDKFDHKIELKKLHKEENKKENLHQIMIRLVSVIKPFFQSSLGLICIAASIRHTAGFAWAYNTQLYFSTYYPNYNLGIWITTCSLVGGTLGVVIGGYVSDKLVVKLGIRARLIVLGASQLIATPFSAGVLFLDPPYAFYSLIFSYLFAEMWFGVLFAVLLELAPKNSQNTLIAIFLFFMNNVGGNAPILIKPLRYAFTYRTALAIMYPGNYFLSAVLFLTSAIFV